MRPVYAEAYGDRAGNSGARGGMEPSQKSGVLTQSKVVDSAVE